MRVLLTTWGSRGDLEPLVGLAVQLQRFGAEVKLAAPADDDLVALLDRAGVEHVPLGPTVRSVVAGEEPPTVDDAYRLAAELVDARFDTLLPAAEGCDVLLATGLLPAGARSVTEKLGIAYVFASFHVYGLPSSHFPPGTRPGTQPAPDDADVATLWKRDAERVNALYREPLNSHRAAIGLPPVDDVHDHVLSGRGLLAADAVLCPWRDRIDVDLVQTGAWILPDDRPIPDELAAFLDAGEPPVYVGFGSMASYVPADIAAVAIEAIRAQGRRIVLAHGWADLVPVDNAEDCCAVGEVNQQALFGRVSAVVHHGGAGTTTTAARAGVPQVIVPQIADQSMSASRVAELGIGVAHDGSTPTVDSLSTALAAALAPEVRSEAATVAQTIDSDGTTRAARWLFNIVGTQADAPQEASTAI